MALRCSMSRVRLGQYRYRYSCQCNGNVDSKEDKTGESVGVGEKKLV